VFAECINESAVARDQAICVGPILVKASLERDREGGRERKLPMCKRDFMLTPRISLCFLSGLSFLSPTIAAKEEWRELREREREREKGKDTGRTGCTDSLKNRPQGQTFPVLFPFFISEASANLSFSPPPFLGREVIKVTD